VSLKALKDTKQIGNRVFKQEWESSNVRNVASWWNSQVVTYLKLSLVVNLLFLFTCCVRDFANYVVVVLT